MINGKLWDNENDQRFSRPRLTELERFEQKVSPEPNSGCWLWIGAYTDDGYGQLGFRGHNTRAHRAAWILYRGEIPNLLCVLHKCDMRCCVNPDHLWLGDDMDNAQDKMRKGRWRVGKTDHWDGAVKRRKRSLIPGKLR